MVGFNDGNSESWLEEGRGTFGRGDGELRCDVEGKLRELWGQACHSAATDLQTIEQNTRQMC